MDINFWKRVHIIAGRTENKELRQQFFLLLSKEELLSTLEIAERIGLNSLLDGGAQYVSDLLSNMTDAEMKAYLDVERDP